jgi:hypothetical protein
MGLQQARDGEAAAEFLLNFRLGGVGILEEDAHFHAFENGVEERAAGEEFLCGRIAAGALDFLRVNGVDEFVGGFHVRIIAKSGR